MNIFNKYEYYLLSEKNMKALNKEEIFKILKQHKEKLKKHHVIKIGIFGSVLRGDNTNESDVDFIVEFEDGKKKL